MSAGSDDRHHSSSSTPIIRHSVRQTHTSCASQSMMATSSEESKQAGAAARAPLASRYPPMSLGFSPDGSLLSFLSPPPPPHRAPDGATSATRRAAGGDEAAASASSERTVLALRVRNDDGNGATAEDEGRAEAPLREMVALPREEQEAAAGKQLSREEELRRERMRLRVQGISAYAWDPVVAPGGGMRFLMPIAGSLYLQTVAAVAVAGAEEGGEDLAAAVKIYDGETRGEASDPKFSARGTRVAFVAGGDLYAVEDVGASNALHRLTASATDGRTNGVPDFLAQEEMDRYTAFWWSPDCDAIAFTQVDDRHIPVYRIIHQAAEETECPVEEHRYPFAGERNPDVRLGILRVDRILAGDDTVDDTDNHVLWIDTSHPETGDADTYIARVDWVAPTSVLVQVQDREQHNLWLVHVDARSGERTVLLRENADSWVNLNDCFHLLPPEDQARNGDEGKRRFLWCSERDGFAHLYLYELQLPQSRAGDAPPSATLVQQITSGRWVVDSVVHADATHGIVYFTGSADSPIEQHLYCASMATNDAPSSETCPVLARVTPPRGYVSDAVINDSQMPTVCAYTWSSTDVPPMTCTVELPPAADIRDLLHAAEGTTTSTTAGVSIIAVACAQERKLFDMAADRTIERLRVTGMLQEPEIVSFYPPHAPDVELFGCIRRPDPAQFGPGPHPTIVYVYGGPHVQLVTRAWGLTQNMGAQDLCRSGFVVLTCDNRGSARRGLAFESTIYRNMGHAEVQDQQAFVQHAVQAGITSPDRVGVYGSSYGGYMTCMCLMLAPDTFHVGVASSSVTFWQGYDTHYTERYMDTPQNNEEGYTTSSAMHHVSKLRGQLLITHGLIDENVHTRHSFRLVQKLIEADKDYQLIILPTSRHSPGSREAYRHFDQKKLGFFTEHLIAPKASMAHALEQMLAATTAASQSK